MKRFFIICLSCFILFGCKNDSAEEAKNIKNVSKSSKELHDEKIAPFIKMMEGDVKEDPKKLIAASIKQRGGLEKLKSIRTAVSEIVIGGASNAKVFIRYPNQLRIDYYNQNNEKGNSLVYSEQKLKFITKGSVSEIEDKKEFLLAIHGDSIPLHLEATKTEAKLTYLGQAIVIERKANVLKIAIDEVGEITFFLDVDNYDLLATQYHTGMNHVTVLESDFKEVEGIRIAHKSKSIRGTVVVEGIVKSLKFNSALGKDFFTESK